MYADLDGTSIDIPEHDTAITLQVHDLVVG